MRCVISGAKGFVASHVVEHLLKHTDWDIVGFDKMGYAALTVDRIHEIDTYDKYKDRLKFYDIDLNLPVPVGVISELGQVDYILHLAAESHVDRSIDDPVPFVLNNVTATLNILEFARKQPNLKMFVNFSTDEVYGPAPEGKSFTEFEYHNPSNPYSASKSAQEAIGIAYSNTYKVPVVTTHTMNIIGERQHPEKFVPMVIRSIVTGDTVQIHADATCTIPGSRFYLHARNLADALLHIINQGYHGYDEWNIAGLEEMDNRALAQHIQRYVNEWQEEHGIVQSELLYELTSFHAERPGHDLRYALDSSKLLKSGYIYPQSFEKSLENTVKWSLNNPKWLDLHDWEV